MPATAGRVRMPANNRVHSSAALQTHGIWQSAIGYDPYAPNKDEPKDSQPSTEQDTENAYTSFQGLLQLARITGTNADEACGCCKKCGRVGHLTFQCRNFLSVKDDTKGKDTEEKDAALFSGFEKINGKVGRMNREAVDESEGSEEEESESSDSEVDSEMEKIIAERYRKKSTNKKIAKSKDYSDEGESDSNGKSKRKRGRSKKKRAEKRESSDSEDDNELRRKRRKEKRRKRDESSSDDEGRQHSKRKSRNEKRRKRSCRYSSDSDSEESDVSARQYKRKTRREPSSESDASVLDDSRTGRDKKRSGKSSRRHRHHRHDK